MNQTLPTLFTQALEIALEKTKAIGTALGNEITLVRDLRGRIRILLPGNAKEYLQEKKAPLDQLTRELNHTLGVYGYPPERAVLFTDDLFHDLRDTLQDRHLILESKGCQIKLLDRQITGQDWGRPLFKRQTITRRVTFFAIKGGVGRSTALTIWAWQLAQQGKKVLVFDLDLESPGVSSILLPKNSLPDYGIIDWFIEDGVGQSELIEKSMVISSPLAKNLAGEIRVIPAYGTHTKEYLPKLARCYAETNHLTHQKTWGERVEQMVEQMEQMEQPDIVFLDSRAGLHDIGAVLATRMGADTFLFANNSPQTWAAYTALFQHWQKHPQVTEFREHLQMVLSMMPETGRKESLEQFCEHSWDLFRDHLYDEEKQEAADSFSFDRMDEDAPHFPLPIFWSRALQEFDPGNLATPWDEKNAMEAMNIFITNANNLIFSDSDSS
ncbi:MAG: AAA family ATPase [Magnetococcus sp. DMHC-6]